jgi:ABC-type multidrug transport system fused ATPase/permease subunit
VLPPLMEFIGGVAFVGALWVGSQEISSGRLTPGAFVRFVAALFMMYAPAKKLSRVNANIQQALAASERIFAILDTHSEVEDRPARRGRRSAAPSSSATCSSPTPAPRRHARRRVADGERGADGGHRRPQRRRQDDAGQPAAAVLRRHRRRDPAGRARHP